MLPPKLQALRDAMDATRARTLAMVEGLSEEAFAAAPAGGWSASQLLEHVLLSEIGTSKVIRKVLKEKAGTMPPYPADDSVLSARAYDDGGPPREAPESVRPQGARAKAEILALAAETRRATHASLEMLAKVDPRAGTFPHPLFGPVDLYEWPAVTILAHEAHHQEQLRGILACLPR